MKKILLMLMFAVVIIAAGVTSAYAGAIVIKDIGCGLSAEDSGLAVNLRTDQSHTVVTPSGNVKLTCHFDIPEGEEPAEDLINKGFECDVFTPDGSIITYNTMSVASTDGDAMLRCIYRED